MMQTDKLTDWEDMGVELKGLDAGVALCNGNIQ